MVSVKWGADWVVEDWENGNNYRQLRKLGYRGNGSRNTESIFIFVFKDGKHIKHLKIL